MRLFALEYFRQFGNADMVHFFGKSKKAQLKIKNQLGPFIFNKREEAWKDADQILSEKLKLKTSFYWAPYDPNHFISLRRIKYRLAAYEHFNIPQIEQHANQQEWVEGTVVEECSEEEIVEKAIKDLEKAVDLESFGQLFFRAPQHLGEGTSSTTTSQQLAQVSAPTATTDKGKGVQHSEEQVKNLEQQETMANRPTSTDEQSQGQDPSTQEKVTKIPVLQTPLNEERAKKRDRQEETPPGTSTEQQGERR